MPSHLYLLVQPEFLIPLSSFFQFISGVRYVSQAYGPHEPSFWQRPADRLYPSKGGKDQTRRKQVLKRMRDSFRRYLKFKKLISKEFKSINLSTITDHETHKSVKDGEMWYDGERATNSEG